MKKPSINAAIFVLIICLTGTAWSAGSVAGSKATNFEGIKRIMSGKQFFSQQQERPYCVKLLKDLRNFKDMHLVEPIAGAENYEDPILNSYKERCGGLPLNEHFFCEGRGDTDDIWSDDPRERRQQLLASSCRQYISTRNFRVYELNIKTDNSNSLETLVFYSERACFVWAEGVSKYECTNGGYTVYYNDNCYVFGGTYTHDPYDYYYNRSLENYNGIILYKGRYLFLDLFTLNPSGKFSDEYSLGITDVARDHKYSCSYSTIKSVNKPSKKHIGTKK